MPHRRSTLAVALRCGLTAAILACASIGAWAGHTDDGCAVELHCFACYWSLTTTVEHAAPSHHGPALEPAGPLPAAQTPRLFETTAPALASRSPPSP